MEKNCSSAASASHEASERNHRSGSPATEIDTGGEFSYTAKTGAVAARLQLNWRSAAVCLDLFCPAYLFVPPATNVPPPASTFIGSVPWRNGKP